MKWSEAIFSALMGIRDDLVEKSSAPSYPRSRPWRWVSAAACCALVLGTVLALGTLQPREPQPLEPDTTPVTVPPEETDAETDPAPAPEQDPWEPPDYLAEYLAPQAVYFDRLSDEIIGPIAAVDDNGTVIAYTDCGTMSPVIDWSTGETLAVLVDERAENQTAAADSRVTLYSLQGEVIQEVEGYYLSCLGDLVTVSRTGGTDLYRRDGTLVAEGLVAAIIVGDDLLYTQAEDGGPVTVYDSTGAVTAENVELQIRLPQHVWQGHGYLCAMDEQNRIGLLDSSGSWALEPQSWYIYDISQGYALCRDESSFCAVSLADGEVAFESPYGIYAAYEQGLLLELDEAAFNYGAILPTDNAHGQFVAWDGAVLAEGRQLYVIDDESDGKAELLYVTDGSVSQFYRPDGTLVRELDQSMGSISVISSETVLCMINYEAEDGQWLMDFYLADLETGAEKRDFGQPYSYGSGLWLGTRDGGRFTTRLIYATYKDEEGFYHMDLLDESGQVLLTGLVDEYSHQKGGVFTVNQGGLPTLVRLDGTVLYPTAEK